MICPKCQVSECWDNRQSIKYPWKPGKPIFACRDKVCGWKGDDALSGAPAPVAVAQAREPLSLYAERPVPAPVVPAVAPFSVTAAALADKWWTIFDQNWLRFKAREKELQVYGEQIPVDFTAFKEITTAQFIESNKHG